MLFIWPELDSGDAFKDKKVVVVGSRSSASDVCQTLVESGASQVYLSHRAGVLVVSPLRRKGYKLLRYPC